MAVPEFREDVDASIVNTKVEMAGPSAVACPPDETARNEFRETVEWERVIDWPPFRSSLALALPALEVARATFPE
jgi:hypothetical protein